MKITIITVFYNNKKGLTRTLNSIINNLNLIEDTYRNIFNILLIDSYSDDGSREFIYKVMRKNKLKFKYINVPKNGVYYAMDQAIQNTYLDNTRVVFINSGDTIFSFNPIIKYLSNKNEFPECISFEVGIFYPPLYKIIFYSANPSKIPAHQGFIYNPNLHKKYKLYENQVENNYKKDRMDLDYIFMSKILKNENNYILCKDLFSLTENTVFNRSRDFKKQFNYLLRGNLNHKSIVLGLKSIIYFIESILKFPLISFIYNLILFIFSKKKIKQISYE